MVAVSRLLIIVASISSLAVAWVWSGYGQREARLFLPVGFRNKEMTNSEAQRRRGANRRSKVALPLVLHSWAMWNQTRDAVRCGSRCYQV